MLPIYFAINYTKSTSRNLNRLPIAWKPDETLLAVRCEASPSKTVTGWNKKTVITINRITSKILFRLTQNVSYIRSSLCSRHLQSFKSVLQKRVVSLALKKCAPNELPGAAGTFGSGGQSSWRPSRIPPLGSLLLLLLLLPSGRGLSAGCC